MQALSAGTAHLYWMQRLAEMTMQQDSTHSTAQSPAVQPRKLADQSVPSTHRVMGSSTAIESRRYRYCRGGKEAENW